MREINAVQFGNCMTRRRAAYSISIRRSGLPTKSNEMSCSNMTWQIWGPLSPGGSSFWATRHFYLSFGRCFPITNCCFQPFMINLKSEVLLKTMKNGWANHYLDEKVKAYSWARTIQTSKHLLMLLKITMDRTNMATHSANPCINYIMHYLRSKVASYRPVRGLFKVMQLVWLSEKVWKELTSPTKVHFYLIMLEVIKLMMKLSIGQTGGNKIYREY